MLAFASRAGGAFAEEEAFRRLLVQRMCGDMDLAEQPPDELRHLHHEYRGQSYLVSYWQRVVGRARALPRRRVARHRAHREGRDADALLGGARRPSRVNVVDEDGRIIFGPPLRSGEFTVGVRFPTTLYGWRVQVSPSASDELTARVQNRAMLELVMVVLSCVVIVLGVATILLAAERERRISALKSEFVANVSHELKTPLALVRMFAEMLQSGRVASDEKRQEYLDIIVQRERAALGAHRERARLRAGRAGPAGLRVRRGRRGRGRVQGRRTCTATGPSARASSSRSSSSRTCRTARIDERAIQLAVINLIDNALKYAPGTERRHRARGRARTAAIVVRVVDRGPGVPPEDRERIFERFVRGSTARARRRGPARPGERHRPGARQAHRREPRWPRLGRERGPRARGELRHLDSRRRDAGALSLGRRPPRADGSDRARGGAGS